MGTHPIFESDFDCLTENESDILSGTRNSSVFKSLVQVHKARKSTNTRRSENGRFRKANETGLAWKGSSRSAKVFPPQNASRAGGPAALGRDVRRAARALRGRGRVSFPTNRHQHR